MHQTQIAQSAIFSYVVPNRPKIAKATISTSSSALFPFKKFYWFLCVVWMRDGHHYQFSSRASLLSISWREHWHLLAVTAMRQWQHRCLAIESESLWWLCWCWTVSWWWIWGSGRTVGSCSNSHFLLFGNAKRQEEGREVFVLTSICHSILVPLQVPM